MTPPLRAAFLTSRFSRRLVRAPRARLRLGFPRRAPRSGERGSNIRSACGAERDQHRRVAVEVRDREEPGELLGEQDLLLLEVLDALTPGQLDTLGDISEAVLARLDPGDACEE